MSRSPDSLPALRDHAVAGLEDLVDLLTLGAALGMTMASPDDARRPFHRVGSFDPAGLAADSRRLSVAYRAVADQLHRLPEQQVRIGRGWVGDTGSGAVCAVIEHQRRAEADLHVLRTLAEATAAASAGIDQLLRTWYLTVARLSAPLVAGIPVTEVPAAVATGRLPLGVVAEDISSRVTLYFTSADATVRGIDAILDHLNRATEDMDVQPYPSRSRVAPSVRARPPESAEVGASVHPADEAGSSQAAPPQTAPPQTAPRVSPGPAATPSMPSSDAPDVDTSIPDADTDVPLRLRPPSSSSSDAPPVDVAPRPEPPAPAAPPIAEGATRHGTTVPEQSEAPASTGELALAGEE
ncbi:hypothetical protein VZC37_01035 [Gordonia sp. LSe1-13]|uniref:DUF222 domain-containing protein n=1 Tax=Gordonia sesuvii TaxID=3116777 RepID=A0ABU7M715_9ACTN|nr:hypothetical protein [Gordonia sp. LSe1-13]